MRAKGKERRSERREAGKRKEGRGERTEEASETGIKIGPMEKEEG